MAHDDITDGRAQQSFGQPEAGQEVGAKRLHGVDLPAVPRLWPLQPMTCEQLEGDWQLIATSSALWHSRRNVIASFKARNQASDSSKSRCSMEAQWSFYEISSYHAKTAMERFREHIEVKQKYKEEEAAPGRSTSRQQAVPSAPQNSNVEESKLAHEQIEADGETKGIVGGTLWQGAGKASKCFRYRPRRLTIQKMMGRDISWEVIAYGSQSEIAPNKANRKDSDQVDWFVAYAHPLPLLHPFLSVYFRYHILENHPDTSALLCDDILDALRHATEEEVQQERGATGLQTGSRPGLESAAMNGRIQDDDSHGGDSGAVAENMEDSRRWYGSFMEHRDLAEEQRDALRWNVRRLANSVRLVRGL